MPTKRDRPCTGGRRSTSFSRQQTYTALFLTTKKMSLTILLNLSRLSFNPKACGKKLKSLPGYSIASHAVDGAELLLWFQIRIKIELYWKNSRTYLITHLFWSNMKKYKVQWKSVSFQTTIKTNGSSICFRTWIKLMIYLGSMSF